MSGSLREAVAEMLKSAFLVLTAALCVVGPAQCSKPVRPCLLSHYGCIRENLAANSQCDRNVRGSIPSEYTVENLRFETPFFNASYVDNTVVIRNHQKCSVSEFTINAGTGTAVLALDCPWLDLDSSRTLYQHYSLRDDSVYNFDMRAVYPLIRLTTVLKYVNKFDLCNTFTLGDVTALPIFKIQPKDRQTDNFLTRDLSLLHIYEREAFFYRAKQLFRYYVNSMICDFKCDF